MKWKWKIDEGGVAVAVFKCIEVYVKRFSINNPIEIDYSTKYLIVLNKRTTVPLISYQSIPS